VPHQQLEYLMKKVLIFSTAAFLAACGTVPTPCDPQRLNCDNGTRATGGAISRPSVSNNPGGLAGGGQVGGKAPGKGGHKGHHGKHGHSKGKAK